MQQQQQQVPAAAVYVKVFAKDRSGDVWFYKWVLPTA